MKKNAVLIIAAVCVGLPVLACGGFLGLAAFVAATTEPVVLDTSMLPEQSVAPENDALTPRLDMAAFSAIKTGMDFEQVVAIAGKPSQQLSELELAGIHSAVYSWESGFSSMQITFSNGQVASKAQFGLK